LKKNEIGDNEPPEMNLRIVDSEFQVRSETADFQAVNDKTNIEEEIQIEILPTRQCEANENKLEVISERAEALLVVRKSPRSPMKKMSEPNVPTNIKLEKQILEDALTNIIQHYDDIPKDSPQRKCLRSRRKSIFVEESELSHNKQTINHYFDEIQKLFSEEPESRVESYLHIEIPQSQQLRAGEVPREWLGKFDDFLTWDDMSFPCGTHCDLEFKNLFSLITHHYEMVRPSDRRISCNFCAKSFQCQNPFPAYINHVGNLHAYTYLKFCCIICSKTFYNVPFLVKHYQTRHKNVHLSVFPCLECGQYFANMSALIVHKRSHDKRRKI